MKTKIEIITCPGCLKYQEAKAKFIDTVVSSGWSYIHECECDYPIMGDDWQSIDPVKELNELESENEGLRNALREIRDLARTGLPPVDMSTYEWNGHKHYQIAHMVNVALYKE